MVLVSDKLSNGLGILQTKLSDRERYETRRVGLEAMPLDEDIEGRHGEGQARLKIGPAPVHDLFEMANERQHGEHRLDEHRKRNRFMCYDSVAERGSRQSGSSKSGSCWDTSHKLCCYSTGCEAEPTSQQNDLRQA